MARRRKLFNIMCGILIGVILYQFFKGSRIVLEESACQRQHYDHDIFDTGDPKQDLLFVGVMTAAQYLDTRAKAVYDTWGHSIPGAIRFFSSQDSTSRTIPVIALPGVDDAYPPQRKSFMMLKYMHDHFIDKFEWFMRADDDVYIKTDLLERLLRSVDSKKPWFIGQTGRGNNEEFGLLSLETDENFCMGGPGVIFSRETLKRVAPFVDECLDGLFTDHEDVELGRCVRRFAGISCTWSYEMQTIFYHNQSGQTAFTGNLNQKEVHRAITLHPVKQPQHMYRLHEYLKGLKVQNLQQKAVNLHRGIVIAISELGYRRDNLDEVTLVPGLSLFPARKGTSEYLGDTRLLGVEPSLIRHKATSLDDVLDWELISKNLYSYKDLNPRKRIGSSMKEGLNNIVREIMTLINSYSKQRGRVIDFKEILYGYWRLNTVHGIDMIVDLLLVYKKYRGHKMTVQVRRHAYIQKTFTGIFIQESQNLELFPLLPHHQPLSTPIPVHKKIVKQLISTFEGSLQPLFNFSNTAITLKKEMINMIVTLKGRFKTFLRFMKMFEEVCLKTNEPVKLIIVLYKELTQDEDYFKTEKIVQVMQEKYESQQERSIISIVNAGDEIFSRAKALELGASLVKDEDLMIFMDIDIVFDSGALRRIRKNTVQKRLLYFPIVYSLYNPAVLNRTHSLYGSDIIDADTGLWRQFGFGIVSLYKSDYRTLGGFNLSISGWGFEDVTFCENAVQSNIKIVRSADPGLIHVYHPIECDSNLDYSQKHMCLGTQVSMLGSLKKLHKLYNLYYDCFVGPVS